MTFTWAALESALTGHRDPSGALDALLGSSMGDVQAMLDAIGAGEAGRLLAQVSGAENSVRQANLAACLEIIDRDLPGVRVRRQPPFFRRSYLVDEASRNSDTVRCTLLACLIDATLGADPERLRQRVIVAVKLWETAMASDLEGLPKDDRAAETLAARRMLQTTIQLLMSA